MKKRLFIGIPVSKEIKDKIKPVYQQLKDTGTDLKFVSLDNLHFTIKFLGDVDDSKIVKIKEQLQAIASEYHKFFIKLKRVGAFPNEKRINVIWIGVEDSQLTSLMKKINERLSGFRKDEHEELPHLTIARVKTAKNKELLQKFLRKNEKEYFGEMIVNKLILYSSELTPEGPVYTVMEEFLLS